MTDNDDLEESSHGLIKELHRIYTKRVKEPLDISQDS
jgi:hypothetical protein